MKAFQIGLLATVALSGIAAPAMAQDNSVTQNDDQSQTDAGGIADIVVTAQKREENVQRAAAAVTALSGDTLVQMGLTDIREVTMMVPNTRFQPESQGTQVYIRGVGTNLGTVAIDQVVSFNVNGVYIQREGTGIPLFDIERIEVLPGPQGTLYGRNAIGGTINIGFRRPTRELESSGVLEVGNYSLIHGTMVQNVPLSDTLAIRLAADYSYNSGYQTSGATSRDDIDGRLSLLWQPRDSVTLNMWVNAFKKNGSPTNLTVKGLDKDGNFRNDAYYFSNPWHDGVVPIFPDEQSRPGDLDYTNIAAGAQLDIDLSDNMTLTYVPGYFYLDNRYNFNLLPGLKQNQFSHFNSTTHELRLTGDANRFQYIVGLYGYHTTGKGYAYRTGFVPGTDSDVDDLTYKGLAVFAQGTYDVTERARLTLGTRYSADSRAATGNAGNMEGAPVYTFDHTFRNFDYKISAEYDLADSAMAYLTFQTGYQPGTFNEFPATEAISNLVSKSKLKALSGGIKSRLFDNRLQLNVEGFYYDYSNYINQTYDPAAQIQATYTGPLTVKGFQLDMLWKPTADDQLNLNVGLARARNGTLVVPEILRVPGTTIEDNTFTGDAPPYAADWTLSAGYFHDFQLGSGYIRAQGDVYYESAYYGTPGRTNGTRQKPHTIGNASLTYFEANNRWSVGAWVRNLGDVAVMGPAAGVGPIAATFLQPPRTYGLRATFSF